MKVMDRLTQIRLAVITTLAIMAMPVMMGGRAVNDCGRLRYSIEHNIAPSDSLAIDPEEIARGLQSALAVEGDTLDWNTWEQVRPWLYFVNQIGWDNEDYLEYSLGEKSIYPLKSYVAEALKWVEKHRKSLTRDRIYKVISLWDRYVHRAGDRAISGEVSDSIVEALYELVIED